MTARREGFSLNLAAAQDLTRINNVDVDVDGILITEQHRKEFKLAHQATVRCVGSRRGEERRGGGGASVCRCCAPCVSFRWCLHPDVSRHPLPSALARCASARLCSPAPPPPPPQVVSAVTPSLYVGGQLVACDRAKMQQAGITTIVNAAGDVAPASFSGEPWVSYLTMYLYDSPKQSIADQFPLLVKIVQETERRGGRTFVHCSQVRRRHTHARTGTRRALAHARTASTTHTHAHTRNT